MADNEPIQIGGQVVGPGRQQRLEIPVSRLPTGTWLSLPVAVVHGRRPGPRIWLSGAVHGDELNGVEIIRQVLPRLHASSISGTVIAVPIVNLYGFITGSRYLPDRRDLNRMFPGSPRGSLTSQLAHIFMTEIVARCGYGVDFHTGSDHRTNLPHLRADLDDTETRRCAEAFGAPLLFHARTRDGSLREAAAARGIHALLYEGGEPQRFDRRAIHVGVQGVVRLLTALGILEDENGGVVQSSPVARASRWVRAGRSGILHVTAELEQRVRKGDVLGTITNTFGDRSLTVRAPVDGMVIGHTTNPLVNRGNAIVHLAELEE